MKKAFAVFSAMLIALGCFGILSKTSVAAAEDEKFTVDPTLEEGETPVYVLGSIADTFPHYYDNEALPDKNYLAARRYPWNETKLYIKKFNDAGEEDGSFGVYFTGKLQDMDGNEKINGAGYGILVFADSVETTSLGTAKKDDDGNLIYKKDDNGNPILTLARYDKGTLYYGHGPVGSSISFMTKNITGRDIEFSATGLANFGATATQMAIVFNSKGQAVRGSAFSGAFTLSTADGSLSESETEALIAPIFCYVDGKIVQYVEGVTVPDKAKVAKTDENGQTIKDENGNIVYELTDQPAFLYQEVVWAWYEEKPENVNEAGFLQAGWDPDKWDLCVEKDGGYLCYAIAGSEGSEHKFTATAQAEFVAEYNKVKKDEDANWVDVSEITRKVIDTIQVPEGGFVYTFGYLERSVAPNASELKAYQAQMYKDALEYGRTEGFGVQRAYNFSSSGLQVKNAVSDNNGYVVLEDNVIEVMPGATVTPGKNVSYTGMTQYFKDLNDITSFTSSEDACEFYISVNGTSQVMPIPVVYQSMDEVAEAVLKDLNEYYKTSVTIDTFDETFATAGTFYSTFNNKLPDFETAYKDTWGWLFDYIRQSSINAGAASSTNSGGNWTTRVWHCLASAAPRSGWPSSPADFSTLNPTIIEQKFTKAPTWSTYSFVASDELDTSYEVVYKVVNPGTVQEEEITLTYVVTDVYTPIIEVNKKGLNVESKVVDGSVVINGGQAITKAQLLTAYNAKYEALSDDIDRNYKGKDITYKVVLDSETLDFENPTEGTHNVVAKVVAQSANTYKEAVERFEVVIRDKTAPVVSVVSGTLNVAYGSVFDPQCGVLAASDNVDGNLKLAAHTWCVDISSVPVNTTKPGSYTVKLAVYDASGNHTDVEYKVKVADAYASADKVDNVASLVEELQETIDEVLEQVNSILASKGCGKSSAALAVQILSAASLLVLVLRKKH